MAWSQKNRPPSEYINKHKAARILAAHGYICHLCGHGGAEQVDHVIPWAEWHLHPHQPGLSVHDQTNLAPAHGQPCPTCHLPCHADKTKAEAARARTRSAQARRDAGRRQPERHPGALG